MWALIVQGNAKSIEGGAAVAALSVGCEIDEQRVSVSVRVAAFQVRCGYA